MQDLMTTHDQRPIKFDFEGSKKEYDLQYGRYAVGEGSNDLHQAWLSLYEVNKRFWQGDQWFLPEDTENFFLDDSGNSRTRIKVTKNFISPVIAQYIGNAITLDITARAKPTSYHAINRREEQLEKLKAFTKIANSGSAGFKEFIENELPIGETEADTEFKFNNIYQDLYVEDINALLEYVSEENKFKEKQRVIAFDLALSGLGVMLAEPHNGDLIFTRVPPEEFFFDRSARKDDLSDAQYMGMCPLMSISDIFEAYQHLTKEIIKSYSSIRIYITYLTVYLRTDI